MQLFINEKDMNINGKINSSLILIIYSKIITRFCPSAFAYLIAIVPCIWLLEINHSSHFLLSLNQTEPSLTILRRFEYQTETTTTTAYPIDIDQDTSDSKESTTEEYSRTKRVVSIVKKQNLSLEELLKTPQEFILKVIFFLHSLN